MMVETKVIYHIDDEDTPYLVKLPVPPENVTFGDLKSVLSRPNVKFFFKTMDDDFGVVKEEITEDSTKLPFFKGRVICWMVNSDETQNSDSQSVNAEVQVGERIDPEKASYTEDRSSTSKLNHSQTQKSVNINDIKKLNIENDPDDTYTETDSQYSADRVPPLKNFRDKKPLSRMSKPYSNSNSYRSHPVYDTSSSIMSSDLETTSFFDSEDESTRYSTVTGTTTENDRHRRQYRRRKLPPISRASSFSSITDSTMTLNVITVTLPMDKVNYLGISLVAGDGCVSVGSIMKEGAVALDGRIDPGDIILEVNGISFEELDRDAAVQLLRESAQRPGPITLVVAKGWDHNPKGYLSIPRQEPVRPIDPRAWVLHTNAMTGAAHNLHGVPGLNHVAALNHLQQPNLIGQHMPEGMIPRPAGGSNSSGNSSITSSSLPESDQRHAAEEVHLTVDTDMITTIRALTQADSGLEIRDRTWLKIRIPNAFIGSDLVDWLMSHVDGFADRKDAHKYASNLLKFGYIRHTVNKVTFSEQCYYVIGNVAPAQSGVSQANIEDLDSVSELGNRYPQGLPQPPSSKWGPPYYGAGNTAPLPGYMPYPTQGGGFPSGSSNQTTANPALQPKTGMNGGNSDKNPGGPVSQSLGRPLSPSTVVSGSAGNTNNCVCLLSTYKAMKGLWKQQDKEIAKQISRNYPKRKPPESPPNVAASHLPIAKEIPISSPILSAHAHNQSIVNSPLLQPPSGGSGMSSVMLATSVQATPSHSLHSSSCLSSLPTSAVPRSGLCDLLSFSKGSSSAVCPNLDVVHAAVSCADDAATSGSEGRKTSGLNGSNAVGIDDDSKLPTEEKSNFPKPLTANPSPSLYRRNFVQV